MKQNSEYFAAKWSEQKVLIIEVVGLYSTSHRAMFKLGGKKLFVLCLLVKNVSAVYSADRCDFSMLNSSCYWISSGPHGS